MTLSVWVCMFTDTEVCCFPFLSTYKSHLVSFEKLGETGSSSLEDLGLSIFL